VVLDWERVPQWRVQLWYAALPLDYKIAEEDQDRDFLLSSTESPEHQAMLRSLYSIAQNVDFDTALRFVDRLPASNTSPYTELMLRIAWRPVNSVELSVVGQHLLNSDHVEFASTRVEVVPRKIERSVLGQGRWWF
jgi:iron complex outermembrane recepter protein